MPETQDEALLNHNHFPLAGVTVNMLLARDMVLLERRKPRANSDTQWLKLNSTFEVASRECNILLVPQELLI